MHSFLKHIENLRWCQLGAEIKIAGDQLAENLEQG